MRFKYLLLSLAFLCFIPSAKADFVMNANCNAAYKAIFELRFNEARRLIQEEKKQNPGNGMTVLLEDYLDYLHLLISGSKADYEKLKDHKSARIDIIKDNDKNSPYYLFAQAEIYIHWGIAETSFGDFYTSVSDVKKARKLLTENSENFRDFSPNQKSLAWVDLIFGAIPSSMKWITGFLGIKGDLPSAYSRLDKFRTDIKNTRYAFYNDEIVFMLAIADVDLMHTKNSYDRLMGLIDTMDDKSQLRRYLQGYVSFKTGHCDEAIKYFSAMPQSAEYSLLPTVSYLLGTAKLCRGDNDADDYLLKFLKENQAPKLTKDTYLKLAYFSLLKNDQAGYTKYLQAVRTQGPADDEKDKQALKEAKDTRPDLDLLRARFYFDGGYYNNALTLLKKQDVADLKIIRDITEYYYRLGRTYDKLNNTAEALTNYQKAINTGRSLTYYYASNAALYSGMICEQKHDYKKAADYYNTTLQMKNHEYQTSTDTQAKEGLNRIKAD